MTKLPTISVLTLFNPSSTLPGIAKKLCLFFPRENDPVLHHCHEEEKLTPSMCLVSRPWMSNAH